jgi:putative flippase GtrA
MASLSERIGPWAAHLKEALRYFGTAVAGLCIDWAAWTAMALGMGLDPVLAQGLSRCLGGVVALVAFKHFVFVHPGAERTGVVRRYWTAWAASWCLSVSLVYALTSLLPGPVAKIATDGVTFLVNYAVMKAWVFGRTPPPATVLS